MNNVILHFNHYLTLTFKICMEFQKYVHQGTQCTIQDTLVDGITNKYLKQSTHTSTRSNKFEKNGQNLKSYPKYNLESEYYN